MLLTLMLLIVVWLITVLFTMRGPPQPPQKGWPITTPPKPPHQGTIGSPQPSGTQPTGSATAETPMPTEIPPPPKPRKPTTAGANTGCGTIGPGAQAHASFA